MKSVDVDRDRYQEGRCIVDVSARGFAPEIGPRSSVDSDRLVVGHGGWKIVRVLVFRDGRHMERGELGDFWHGNYGPDSTNLFIAVCNIRITLMHCCCPKFIDKKMN